MPGVARSSFYAWRARAESATTLRRRELEDHVARVFARSRRAYGCRRVAAQLNREGVGVSVGTVADIMRGLRLHTVQPRAWRKTTVPGEAAVESPDLIAGDFDADAPGRRLVGDITYLATGQGWLYLATVMDLATRMVVGWKIADHMRTSLVVDAGHAAPDAVFHSDRGSRYTSEKFTRRCADHGISTILGRTSVCWDNAAAESFFASLKNECYHQTAFATRAAARPAVADYIEVFYNRQRIHSTLEYKTPAEAMAAHYHRAA